MEVIITQEVLINQNQARELARAIKKDIFDYIESHQVEYQEFLSFEQEKLKVKKSA